MTPEELDRTLVARRGKSVMHIVTALLDRQPAPRPAPAPMLMWVDEAADLSPEFSTWWASLQGTRTAG